MTRGRVAAASRAAGPGAWLRAAIPVLLSRLRDRVSEQGHPGKSPHSLCAAECVSLTAKRVCRTCSDTLHCANIPNAFLAPRRVFGLELTARPQVPSRSLTQEPPPQLPPAPHPMPPAPKHEFQSRRQRLFLPVFVCTTRLLGALRSLLARAWPPALSLGSKPCSLPSRFCPELCSEPAGDGTWLCPPLCVSHPAPGAEATHVTSLAACAPLAVTAAKGSVGGEGGEVSLFLI